ncbi:MAG: flagellar motor protein MotD [Betaproteobacteria bacterium]|nr:flagellar motor protein MotD [Betaproteobacteria bacterium]
MGTDPVGDVPAEARKTRGSHAADSRRTRLRHRRRGDDDGEQPDRWIVSYADFVTLLLAFFVVMYAISSVNESRYREVSDALVKAFQPVDRPPDATSIVPPPIQLPYPTLRNRLVPMQSMANDIRSVLDPLVRAGEVRVTETSRGIAVEINASVLFASGEAELTEASVRILNSVAGVLARAKNRVEVEGHTDNSPISSTVYPSNWELSAARACSVVRLFARDGVAPERMGAVGYGEYRSVATNETQEGRNRNRRVTVVILPLDDDGSDADPTKGEAGREGAAGAGAVGALPGTSVPARGR